MTHYLKLNPFPFFQIESGNKTIELRLYDEKRKEIKIEDHIIFTHREDDSRSLTAKVTHLHTFVSFRELYATLPLLKCGYTEQNVHTADFHDMAQYYSQKEQELYGVVGIEFELI